MMIIPDIRPSLINPANAFTLARLPLLLVGFALYLNQSRILGVAVIALAALTDFFDGRVARRFHCETEFGRKLDPTVDKVFMVITLAFTFTQIDPRSAGFVVMLFIVAIEFILAWLTFLSVRTYHKTPEVVRTGKWGMFGRMTSVGSILASTAVPDNLHQAFLILGVTSGSAGFILGVVAAYAYARQMDEFSAADELRAIIDEEAGRAA